VNDTGLEGKADEPKDTGTLPELMASVGDSELEGKAIELEEVVVNDAPGALLALACWVDDTTLEGKTVETKGADEAPGALPELANRVDDTGLEGKVLSPTWELMIPVLLVRC